MVIGIVAVVAVAAIVGAFYLGRGGDDENASTGTTPTATQTTPTATQTQTVVTVTVPAETQPTPAPAPAPAPAPSVEIVEQSINPPTVARGGPLAINVRTRGDVLSVRMEINGPQPMNVDLNRGPTVNDVTTWIVAANAPGVVGLYRYSAKASAANGSLVEAPVSTFTVVP